MIQHRCFRVVWHTIRVLIGNWLEYTSIPERANCNTVVCTYFYIRKDSSSLKRKVDYARISVNITRIPARLPFFQRQIGEHAILVYGRLLTR